MRSRRSWPNAPRAWKRKGPMAAARVDKQGIPAYIMGPRLVLMLSVLALTLKSGMEFEKGLELAGELVDNGKVAAQIEKCGRTLETGASYYQAMKETGLFSGFYVQMIKVGSRSGRLDAVMEEISEDFEQAADQSMDNMLARFEPTIVAVLAVSVGLVLLSVMLPLVGVLAAIG